MSKIRILTAGAVSLALAGTIACGGASTPDATPGYATAPAASAEAGSKPAAKAKTPPVSAEQRNATRSAESYLDGGSGFSRKSLISQLKYEGFSVNAATAAVDSLHVDWNAQAEIKAKSYLDGSAFSRKSLLAQLKYEGFTAEQAAHGVKKAGL